MKRIITIFSLLAAILSCSDSLTLEPAASLFAPEPKVLDETAVFRLAVANMADTTQAITFPVTFGGTAERGTDYEASADAFVFGGENPVDSIVVTTLRFATEKTVSLTVELPEGFEGGKFLTSGYTLQDKVAYLSLSRNYAMLADSLDIGFSTASKNGASKFLSSEAEISLSINTEKTTAIEGVDFAFSDSSRYIIPSGEGKGSLEIRSLNPHPEEGRDRIVLNMEYNRNRYGEGATQEIEISLIDTLWKHLDGGWLIDTLITDSLHMAKIWGDSCTGLDLLPEFNESDGMAVNLPECTLRPSFRSTFSYYFKGTSNIRKGNKLDLDLGNGENAQLHTFILDNTDRWFSSEEDSDDKESIIGFRFLDNGTSATDSLDMYIIDYTSKTFMPEHLTEGRYAPEKPTAASPGLFLNLTFNRQ